jgi:hypothetical protein
MKQYIVKVYEDRTEWYNEQNQLDRDDGPAIESADGSKWWYRNYQLDRDDGPAIELANGTKYWFRNGQPHREDGPAIEYADGTKYWYLNGQNLSEEEFHQRTSKPVSDCSGKIVEIDSKKHKLTLC